MRFHAAERSRSAGAFWPEMFAPRSEDLVHKSLGSERQAIGKVTHPAAQHLPVVEPAFRGQHGVHFFPLEPAPQRPPLLIQPRLLAPAKEQQPILGQDRLDQHG